MCTWGIPDHALLRRLSAIDMPVFVANGDSDPMILPYYSYLIAGLIPQAQVKIYPDAAHGFLFQHHAEFASDVEVFLPAQERSDLGHDEVGGRAVQPFDPTRPNIARVWDYWLGGKDNFAADRELAQKLLEVHPPSAQMARENRQFLGRAVRFVAARGIRQFVDVGPGLPTAVNTHNIAQQVSPRARVAYVDNDPMVVSHARSLLARSPGVIAVPGDMRDPGSILADAALTELIDLAEPTCVILSGVLHFVDAGTARGVAAVFAKALVPGSYLIISVGSGNASEGKTFTSAYSAARVYIHPPEEIERFFDGFELVPPGVVSVMSWYGDGPAPDLTPPTATFLGGVAQKP